MKQQRIINREFLDTYHHKGCKVCGRIGSDPAHIKSRGAGGDDVEWNLMPLCRAHHQEQHKVGWFMLSMKYVEIKFALGDLGWGFINCKLFRFTDKKSDSLELDLEHLPASYRTLK